LGGEGESFRARHYSHFEASISGRPLKLVSWKSIQPFLSYICLNT
jgi:hypothetical protein